jgi:DNA-directed RNA polymerase specialized sigma24 family protein
MMDELVKYLRALVYLQARQLSDEHEAAKPEVLLANAGLSYKEIAEMLGKKEPAVAKAVSRARGSERKD